MIKRLFLLLLAAQLFAATANAGGTSGLTRLTAGLGLGLTAGTCGGATTTSATIAMCIAPGTAKTTDYTLVNGDGGSIVAMNSGSAHTITVPQATSAGNFAKGWCTNIVNIGAGILTISPQTSTISGAPTSLAQNGWISLCSDGTNYTAQGSGGALSTVTSIGSGLTLVSGVLDSTGGGGSPGGASGAFQYNSGSSTFSGTTVVNDSVLTRGHTGTPAEIAMNADGKLLIGSASGAPLGATLTAGSNITITNAANAITIAASSSASTNLGTATSAASPQVTADATTGLYTAGAGKVDVSISNAKVVEWASTGESVTGTITGTSASATALTVGPNGATNPVLAVDGSTSSSVSGFKMVGAATTVSPTIIATDSNSNVGAKFSSKGSGTTTIISPSGIVSLTPGAATYNFQNNSMAAAQTSKSSGVTAGYAWAIGSADTGLTASTEAPIWTLNSAGITRTHAQGNITLQRDTILTGTTDAFSTSASTVTDGATLALARKSAGTNGTITNNSALYVGADSVSNSTNSYGININAASGATNNYAARLNGVSQIGPMIDIGPTKFTISGCSAGTTVGGATTGQFASGTSGTCTVVITMNGATGATAPNGWACSAHDITTPADVIAQTATSTTTATVSGTTASGDTIVFQCKGY